MSALMEKAIDQLNERGAAAAAGGIEVDDNNVMVHANPEKFVRTLLLGFVPTEEIDHTVDFLQQAVGVIRHNWMLNPSRAQRDALVLTTMAQMLLVGTVLGKGDEEC